MKENINLPTLSKDQLSLAFEQYKTIIESQNKSRETRENANHFWVTINTLSLSAIAYVRDNDTLSASSKTLLIWTLVLIGLTVCTSWFSYLSTLKKEIYIRNSHLVIYEQYFPLPIYRSISNEIKKWQGESSLTFREMFVPGVFLAGYLFFIILYFFYPSEVAHDLMKIPPS